MFTSVPLPGPEAARSATVGLFAAWGWILSAEHGYHLPQVLTVNLREDVPEYFRAWLRLIDIPEGNIFGGFNVGTVAGETKLPISPNIADGVGCGPYPLATGLYQYPLQKIRTLARNKEN